MAAEITGLRTQILANARIMLKPSTPASTPIVPGGGSQSTLISHPNNFYGDLDIVVHGHPKEYTAVLMAGLTPAIESGQAPTPEAAMRQLFIATAELLRAYIPKVGVHQRAIHGGGVFDEDLICGEIIEAQKKF